MNVQAIIGVQGPDGVWSFYARLEHNGGIRTLQISAAELTSYRAFQLAVLLATGHMPWLPSCEHRTPDDADSCWRLEVKNSLEHEAAKEQQAQKAKSAGGSAIN